MSTALQRQAPLRPDLTGPDRLRPATHIYRAALAALRHTGPNNSYRSAADAAEQMYPGDPVTPRLVLRGAAVPATIANSTWAGALAAAAVGDFIASLGPESAGARLIAAGVRLSLDGIDTLSLPQRSGLPVGDDTWIGEGLPIPVKRFALTSGTLGPERKLASMVTLTRETAEHASGEEVLSTMLREDMAASLDVNLFDTNAASALRPAGLLYGVAPITATSGGGTAAMLADLETLAGALAKNGGSGLVVYIMAAQQAASAGIRLLAGQELTIWPSRALAAGTVIAIDPRAFASAFGSDPDISASSEVIVNMEDTAPAPISTVGTPNVVAAPIRSAWQTDCVALRVILKAAWAMRAPSMVQYLTGATWGPQS